MDRHPVPKTMPRLLEAVILVMSRLFRATIWHPDAIKPEDWKQRHTLRVWLPLYDLVVIGAGIWAAAFGSPILWRLFPASLVETAGVMMAVAGLICFVGITLPALWVVELLGKLSLIFLLGSYAGTVAFFPSNPDASNGFVVFILVMALWVGFIRVTELADTVRDALVAWRVRRSADRGEV